MSVILYSGHLSLALCRQHRDKLFVFGDNLQGKGTGGQACIRHAVNSVGVPTKIAPSMHQSSFFTDGNDNYRLAIDMAMTGLLDDLGRAQDVVIPVDRDGRCSLGCGLARLPVYAPGLHALIQGWIDDLVEDFGRDEIVEQII